MTRPVLVQTVLLVCVLVALGAHAAWITSRKGADPHPDAALEKRVSDLEAAARKTAKDPASDLSPEFKAAVEAVIGSHEEREKEKRKTEALVRARQAQLTALQRDLPRLGLAADLQQRVEDLILEQMKLVSDSQDLPTPQEGAARRDQVNAEYLEKIVALIGEEHRAGYVALAKGWYAGLFLPKSALASEPPKAPQK